VFSNIILLLFVPTSHFEVINYLLFVSLFQCIYLTYCRMSQGNVSTPDATSLLSDVYLSQFTTVTKRLPYTNVTIIEVAEPNSVYCPAGTSVPLTVRPGYFTVGINRTTRASQEPCPMGSYCVNG
jgi:hypothetical protein